MHRKMSRQMGTEEIVGGYHEGETVLMILDMQCQINLIGCAVF